ncbi:MAG: histidinol-phosphate transaminase [Cytophagales bacterium]|nr:histidinol-phosphate transaminase [Cytophagales bacterium]
MNASRRALLKSGLLTVGGLTVAPHLSMSESWRSAPKLDASGNALYSPFFKEYLADPFDEKKAILAKLNANENPYGPSPKAVKAHQKGATLGNRYAWREMFQLMDMLAEKEGVTAGNIMMGPGSSDLLEKTGVTLFLEGGNIVSADPAYMSMIRVAEATGATWKGVPLKSDWSHDLEGMEKAIDKDTKLVYVCNPNNPTGSLTDANALEDFCRRVSKKVPVFVDEAYLEFLPKGEQKSMAKLVAEGENVIVARTFSKIHGMAGLRVGYVVGLEDTLGEIQAITRAGMGITYPSVMAAIESLGDTAFQDKSRKLNTEAREYVCAELKKKGFEYVPSVTSFVLFPIEMEGKSFLEKMKEQQVAVRAFDIVDQNWCRVSMGTMEEMKLFVSALGSVLI